MPAGKKVKVVGIPGRYAKIWGGGSGGYPQHCTPVVLWEISFGIQLRGYSILGKYKILLCFITKQSITGNKPLRCLSTFFKKAPGNGGWIREIWLVGLGDWKLKNTEFYGRSKPRIGVYLLSSFFRTNRTMGITYSHSGFCVWNACWCARLYARIDRWLLRMR